MPEEWRFHIPRAEARQIRATNADPETSLIVVKNYAMVPLPEAIKNPGVLLPVLGEEEKDVTAFYSRTLPFLPLEKLVERTEFDLQARTAAKKLGTLDLYYPGKQIPNPDKLEKSPDLDLSFDVNPDAASFCIWHSLEQAKLGSMVAEHIAASKKTREWYGDNFDIKKYTIRVEPGAMPSGEEAEVIVFQNRQINALREAA